MRIIARPITTSGNNADLTSYATATVAPTSNRLLLVWVYSIAASVPNTPTATGNGLTWTAVTSVTDGVSNRRLTLFRAMGEFPSEGPITFNFGGQTQTGCAWSVVEYDFVDTSGSNGANAIVQYNQLGSGANQTSLSVTLSAFESEANAVAGGFGIPLNTANLPAVGSGFSPTGQQNQNNPNLAIGSQFSDQPDTSVDMTSASASVPWTGIAVELRARVDQLPRSRKSATDSGFANLTDESNEEPFRSGDMIGFTVQEPDALAEGDYSWRVRASDPDGSNEWGEWSDIREFTIASTDDSVLTSTLPVVTLSLSSPSLASDLLEVIESTLPAQAISLTAPVVTTEVALHSITSVAEIALEAPDLASTHYHHQSSELATQTLSLDAPNMSSTLLEIRHAELVALTLSLEAPVPASDLVGEMSSELTAQTLTIAAPMLQANNLSADVVQLPPQTIELSTPPLNSDLIGDLESSLDSLTLTLSGQVVSQIGIESELTPAELVIGAPPLASNLAVVSTVGETIALEAPAMLSNVVASGTTVLPMQTLSLTTPALESVLDGEIDSASPAVMLNLTDPALIATQQLQSELEPQTLDLESGTLVSTVRALLVTILDPAEIELSAPAVVSQVLPVNDQVLEPAILELTAPALTSTIQLNTTLPPHTLTLSNPSLQARGDSPYGRRLYRGRRGLYSGRGRLF